MNLPDSSLPEEIKKSMVQIENNIRDVLAPYYQNEIQGKETISEEILKTSGYAEHFPHQLAKEQGSFCTPASCLHVYQEVKINEDVPVQGVLINCLCTRNENEQWKYPFRLKKFHMLELVLVSNQKDLEHYRQELKQMMTQIFEQFEIPGALVSATDAFFLAEHEGARLMQKMKQLKQEFQTKIDDETIPLASLNYHEEYFTSRFSISTGKHSLCLAFGLERIAFARAYHTNKFEPLKHS